MIGNNTYICQCKKGYVIAADGITCIKCARSSNPTWHVALCNASNDDTICSGTAISDQWVLTSARCVCNNDTGIDKQSLSIRFGKTRTCFYTDNNETQHTVSEIYCNPNYAANALTVDIAAIKLQSPIPISVMKQSPPLCINNVRKTKKLFSPGRLVEIFGWGMVGKTVERNSTLQSTGNVQVAKMKCKKIFREEGIRNHSDDGVMCTMANTTSACTGNYGSAVIARKRNKIYFGGIVSKVTSVCGATNSYLAHSKLYAKTTLNWVKSITQP